MTDTLGDRKHFQLVTKALQLSARHVPWDSEPFGFPVAAIESMKVHDADLARRDFTRFMNWLDEGDYRLASCRTPIDQLASSLLLEDHGFRFIEVALQPCLTNFSACPDADTGFEVNLTEVGEIAKLREVAATAFTQQRYHVDPRLDPRLSNLRYARWLESAADHPTQKLLTIRQHKMLVGFFVVETLNDASVYWHLTALVGDQRGQGTGYRTWTAMIQYHRGQGATRISTTIAARNIAAFNLYAKLNFRFPMPLSTFHWVRQ